MLIKKSDIDVLNVSGGFTLIELLVVVGMMMILMSVVIPDMVDSIPGYRLKTRTQSVVSDLQSARMRSVSENSQYKVTFDGDDQSYWIAKGNLSSGSTQWETQGSVKVLTEDSGDIYQKGVALATDSKSVTFFPTGYAAGSTIRLVNIRGEAMDISISGTGRIRVEKVE